MITKALLYVIGLVAKGLDAAIPDLTIPYESEVENAATWLGSQVGFLEPVLPVSTLATAFAWVVTVYMPVWFTFVAVRWAYSHIPFLGGS